MYLKATLLSQALVLGIKPICFIISNHFNYNRQYCPYHKTLILFFLGDRYFMQLQSPWI